MARRIVKRRKLRKTATGDRRDVICLYNRAIEPPEFDSADFGEDYELIEEVFAKVETPNTVSSGERVFDGVHTGPDERATHIFSIRYDCRVTTETRIKFKEEYYKILEADNWEERDQELVLGCRLLGDEDNEVNL